MEFNNFDRKIALVVDDQEVNRAMLCNVLKDDMEVLEAADADEAISLIDRNFGNIGIVLLDLVMPGKSGFDVLAYMNEKKYIEDVPVIVISGADSDENVARAFELGAIDFTTKPFSSRILLRRIMSTVSLFYRKRAIALDIDKRLAQRDKLTDELTGLNTENSFNTLVYDKLKSSRRKTLCMVAIDIDHFKLFNRFYGRSEGDKYLQEVGEMLRGCSERYGAITGYLGGDNFAALIPNRQDVLADMKDWAMKILDENNYEIGYVPKFGVYAVEDPTETVMDIVDHAFTALNSIKTNYAHIMAWYSKEIVRTIRDEFVMLSDVERALKNHEFAFNLQPKVNMLTGKVVGAEALIRWNHREQGVIQPTEFIPILEKHGFITRVDQVLWESVCAWQRKWIDDGHEPLPISVNVSRNDMFSLDFTNYFLDLMEKYHLPTNLIELEITESSYVEEYEQIGNEISKLHNAGFSILLDDFGSGYSSLNSLKELDIDVLKIDMKFLHIDYENKSKGVNILESMINMGNQLRLPVIIEGVELKDQVDLLTEMGYRYAQGYYFSRPLNTAAYEDLLLDEENVDYSGIQPIETEQVHMINFSEEKYFTDEMINNIMGAVAFYEVKDNTVRLIRLNEQYYKMMDMAYVMADTEYATHLRQSIYPEDRDSFIRMFHTADDNPVKGSTADIRYMKDGIDMRWIRFRIYPLRKTGDSRLYYGQLEDITDIYQGA